ncbi:MAG: hypothetical protein R6X10_02210 [Desulfobacterales bacterium]
MKNILRNMFELLPGEKTIVLKEKCSDCGREAAIEVTRTSGGFGLRGGAIFKSSSGAYFAKCLECYTSNPKSDEKKLKCKGLRPVDL